MLRKVNEDTRLGVGSYNYSSNTIYSLDAAIAWLCRARDISGYEVGYIRLEDIDGNENDTTTRMSADSTPEEILNGIEGKEIGRLALVGVFMGSVCRVSVYLKGYTINLFLDTLDPFVRDRIVAEFQNA